MGASASRESEESLGPRNGPNIYLNVYTAKSQSMQMPGFGIYHSGVEISGREYSFAGQPGAPGSGVFDITPRSSPPGSDWVFKEQLDLGKTPLSSAQLTSVLSSLRGEFLAKDYDLVGKNCNHFSEMVCDRAKVKFPAWVNRAANVGGMFTGKGNPTAKAKAIEQRQKAERDMKEKKRREREALLSTKQSALKAEPPSEADDICEIQVNCPNGTKTKRRFYKTDTVQDVMNFVAAFDLTLPKKFLLRSNYPRKLFSAPKLQLQLAGMGKRENLFVEVGK